MGKGFRYPSFLTERIILCDNPKDSNPDYIPISAYDNYNIKNLTKIKHNIEKVKIKTILVLMISIKLNRFI
jgi:hypothetical protein